MKENTTATTDFIHPVVFEIKQKQINRQKQLYKNTDDNNNNILFLVILFLLLICMPFSVCCYM